MQVSHGQNSLPPSPVTSLFPTESTFHTKSNLSGFEQNPALAGSVIAVSTGLCAPRVYPVRSSVIRRVLALGLLGKKNGTAVPYCRSIENRFFVTEGRQDTVQTVLRHNSRPQDITGMQDSPGHTQNTRKYTK